MNKKLIIGALIGGLVLAACSTMSLSKTVVNREVNTPEDGPMLLGKQTLNQFSKTPYTDWFAQEKASYVLDNPSIEKLKKANLSNYRIIAFVGTWCPDTHREFPRLVKVLEAAKYPLNKMEIVALSRRKESPTGEEVMAHIEHVPTFIVKKYGVELGRIVEAPSSGYLERDLLQIIEADKKASKKD